MIDEEDDEEILKKKRSLKKILKNLVLLSFIAIGVLFMYMGGPDPTLNLVIGFTFICLGTSIIQMKKDSGEPIRQTLTILKCKSCGAIKVRNHESGDFVFKTAGVCEKCNESMEIVQIYSVKLKKAKETDKKLEKDREKLQQTIKI
ncbi:MAG: hypothetical protein HWN80_12770 [Candidatus Lokiarchaeota archaeon]|nr:hypothetical protein [Candidatus Lokiarchaeota archaeon]